MTTQDSRALSSGRRAAALARGYAVLCFLSALAGISIFDRLTSSLFVLSTFLFLIVARYSKRYLLGDPGQARFMFWLCLTGTFVFALVIANNLLLFVIAWCGISLSLHHLLQFYQHRRGAVLAARKKFIISRLGDGALIASLVLTYATFGTWDFQVMFTAAEGYAAAAGRYPPAISWICGLLVFAALLKSAQFPFHSWLPDTMETPTPVSALMHAGIINAGGILVIRMSPIISLSNTAMVALCLVGGITAVFASVVMLTQASVKRFLAFSTVAQMGFMMLECGLGAVHLALLHLIAHSLYKAHAFLSTGSAVTAKREMTRPRVSVSTIGLSFLAALTASYFTTSAAGLDPRSRLTLILIFSIALAQMLSNLWLTTSRAWRIPLGLLAVTFFSIGYAGMDTLAEFIVAPVRSDADWIGLSVALVLLLLAVAQDQCSRWAHAPLVQKLYVHARNGFYINTLANRVAASVWPATLSQEEI